MQEADQTLRAACEQRHACNLRTAYADEHFSRKKQVFLQLPTSSRLVSLQSPTSSGRQISSSRRQPTSTSRRRSSFLTEQISAFRPPATSLSPTPVNFHPFRPPTFKHSASPFSINFPPKKTEPKAQFFPLYISSTFPGLYNPQFSSCNTKPKCLRIPAKSGSLVLSSVITGLSFSSHSRLNSISLLPRPL